MLNGGVIFVVVPRFYTMVHFGDRKINKEEMNISEEIVSALQGLIKTIDKQELSGKSQTGKPGRDLKAVFACLLCLKE